MSRVGTCDRKGCNERFVDTSQGQTRRFCSDNCRKRDQEATTGRGICIDCGAPAGIGTKKMGGVRCLPCERRRQVEESQTGQIVRLFNEGRTLQQIATELGIPRAAIGPRLHCIRHTDYGTPYIERYGFPEYRRTPEQIAHIRAGSRKGQGLAA